MSTLPPSNLPPIDQALVPASVRGGNTAAQQAYQTGLAFEQMLVQQLAQQMASTASSSDGSSDASSDGSADGASGLMGSDPANTMYAQLLPTALSSGIMSAGGMGIAQQLASALDPALLSAGSGAGRSASSAGTTESGHATGGAAVGPSSGGVS